MATDNIQGSVQQVFGNSLKKKENEIRLRAFLAATGDVIYRMNADWTVMYMLDGKGLLSDTGTPIEDWMEKYTHPDDRQLVKNTIAKAVQNKSIYELENRVLLSDGAIGWVFSRAVPVLDEDGYIVEWIGTASDITSRKQTEHDLQKTKEQLEESKRLYEAITGSTPDLIYVFNLNYRFIYANRALLEMWGRTEQDAMGRGLLELGYEPWHAEMHEREIDEVVATKKTIRGEVSFPHATLGRRMYDYIFAPVFNEKGEVYAVAGTTRDISDLKMAEDSLKQSEEQFRTLTQSLPQLIWTAETNGYCDFFNQRWYDYTGSTPELSVDSGWTKYIHPQHRNNLFSAWQQSLQSGTPIVYEFQLKAKDDSYNWFYVIGNPIKDADGNIRKWVGTLTNIEDQKAVEEKLESLVKERTKELQQSNEDLQQFAHVASHDLKEPVRKTKTFASRLEKELGETMSEKGRLYLDKIYSATDRMNSMIEGVLTYATIGNMQQSNVQVNLNDILKDIKVDLEVSIEQKNAIINHQHLPTIEGSQVLLYQLFYNLINNSLKFAKATEAPIININAESYKERNRQFVRILVQDNGIGFDQDQAERIFNTFTRLNSKDKYEGTGLGLALCRKIVERHMGTIKAEAAEDEGALFIITLPIHPL